MSNENPNKPATVIIYFLVIFLICLVLYNLFILINRTYSSNESPINSIKVGPISAESKY